MNASGSSSSGWPTPAASIANDGENPQMWFARRERLKKTANNGNGAGVPLTVAASSWPTPAARDGKGVDRQEIDRGNARPLNEVASTWATPTAHDGRRPGADLHSTQGRNLSREIAQWSTPSVADVTGGRKSRSGDRSGELLNNSLAPYLTNNVYPTPTALNRPRNDETLAKCTAYRKAKAGQNTAPLYLEEVVNWATPTSLSFSESHQPGNSHSYNANMAKANARFSGLQAPPTSTPGEWSPNALLASYLRYRATTCSALRWERRALLLMAIRRRGRGWTRKPAPVFVRPSFRRQLNPRFVEWLMAWPPGSTSFACSATAYRTHAEHWRSELSRLGLPPARPGQWSLFG